jgi:hypothetical protein
LACSAALSRKSNAFSTSFPMIESVIIKRFRSN